MQCHYTGVWQLDNCCGYLQLYSTIHKHVQLLPKQDQEIIALVITMATDVDLSAINGSLTNNTVDFTNSSGDPVKNTNSDTCHGGLDQ